MMAAPGVFVLLLVGAVVQGGHAQPKRELERQLTVAVRRAAHLAVSNQRLEKRLAFLVRERDAAFRRGQKAELKHLLSVAHGRMPPTWAGNPKCAELCKDAKGFSAQSCITECRVHTDVAPRDQAPGTKGDDVPSQEALKDFVEDQTVNEQGGETLEKSFEKMTGEDIGACNPTFTGEPHFEDFDRDGDGYVTEGEFESLAGEMCVPDEMAVQMFGAADLNHDKVVDKVEYEQAAEDTKAESALDEAIDPLTDGEDQYSEVKLPGFELFDTDGSGSLDTDEELEQLLMFEFERRHPDAKPEDVMSHLEDMLGKFLNKVDKDGDGEISKAEYGAKQHEDDLGEEMEEAAKAPSNAQDPDDLKSVDSPTQVPPPPDYVESPAVALFRARHPRHLRARRWHRGW